MYEPDGTETLVLIKVKKKLQWVEPGLHRIAIDDETYAHFLNSPDIEVIEETMVFSRLDPAEYEWLRPPSLEKDGTS